MAALMIIKRESILFTWPEFVNRVGVKIDPDFGKNSRPQVRIQMYRNRQFKNYLHRQGVENEIYYTKEGGHTDDSDG